ncbi:copia protein, partial [Tanacetum coccineum]
MSTEMELTLEQTQQGVSYEVSNIRVNSFTIKMEILLEPALNKLRVEHAEFDESNANVLERFYTSAGNPVKEILLKLNLPDHRILKDGGEGTKWVFRNKLDENGIVSQNKARLVSQGYNQQEGIDYDETYAPVARLESIRILLAYACALDFKLFQMDVKSAFLNGFINEE